MNASELDAAIIEETAARIECDATSGLCKTLDEQQRGWLLRREHAFQKHASACRRLVRAIATRERIEKGTTHAA
jgi:hypothetical protein